MAKTSKTDMKAIIFAGGIGTRMWPLSRKSSPKQFEPIINGKSTLQLSLERLLPEFNPKNIYISTGEQYIKIISKQIPQIPKNNIVGEPEMRDVGPAVGYLMTRLSQDDPDTPVAILWSDHLVEHVDRFKQALISGGKYLASHPDQFVFIGQRPRFANQNLGWIEYGSTIQNVNGSQLHTFESWHYRPDISTAKKYFKSGKHAWNPGYFVVTPKFVLQKFKKHAPQMYKQLQAIKSSLGTKNEIKTIKKIYPQMEKVDFDTAILQRIPQKDAVVMSVELGWSDVGTWESLKEALQAHPSENVTHGNVYTHKTSNSIIHSHTKQLVTSIDLDDVAVVVTDDVVMVTRQSSIPEIKTMLKLFDGTKLEKYT